ncbi:MAG TPA: YHS domain-containing protein, partial [Methylovirgula sp.]
MMTSLDAAHDHHHDHNSEGAGATVIDPVCGMSFDPATAKHHLVHAGHDYFFCSGNCREKFEAAPESYLKPVGPKPAPITHDHVRWTCPMHP